VDVLGRRLPARILAGLSRPAAAGSRWSAL
jgi:hypothetical protein